MNITYMNLMLEYPIIQERENQPVEEKDILSLENRINRTFPTAYKEFLVIAGDGAGVIAFINHGFYLEINGFKTYIEYQQDYTKRFLAEEGLSIGDDFWVICDLDGGEQFHFFYFNDPDAIDPENPPVYLASPGYIEDDVPLKERIADTFQDYIEEKIRGYAGLS